VIINRELGPKPYLDVSDLSGSEAFVLHMFAYADVSRTICKRNRQTVFDFGPIPADGFHSARPNVSGEVCDGYLGLPSGLLACLGATANLAAKMHTELPATVDGEAVAIEGAIRRWRAHESRMDLEGTRRLSRVAVQEIWRMVKKKIPFDV